MLVASTSAAGAAVGTQTFFDSGLLSLWSVRAARWIPVSVRRRQRVYTTDKCTLYT